MEYHKIETLYERDEVTHKLKEPLELKNRVYGIIKTFEWTEKIDGTNIRITWDNSAPIVPTGVIRFDGRQDNSQIDTQLLKHLQDTFTAEKFEAAFEKDRASIVRVVLYGEGFGPGIQRGGGYWPTKAFIAFDCLVTTKDKDGKVRDWWLGYENVRDVAKKIGVPVVPHVGEMTLEEATEYVRKGFKSFVQSDINAPPERQMDSEGLVGRPVECLFDKKGARIIVKLKTKDFLQVKVKDPAFANAVQE